MKSFKEEQKKIREELTPLLTIREVRDILSCGANVIFRLIESGELEAYDLFGKHLSAKEIDQHQVGVRVSPSSVQSYLERVRVG